MLEFELDSSFCFLGLLSPSSFSFSARYARLVLWGTPLMRHLHRFLPISRLNETNGCGGWWPARLLVPRPLFLVVASDGLWDKVSNQEAVDVVSRSQNVAATSSVACSCAELMDMARRRGSKDDVTVMVVDLERFVR
ncbi:putative protein phosphatase 2C 74 [Panicum miliaceum]|uniref:protein-serine/threonine phosphatase n=1 Tax=Panicum miliaceum TaxID=4540 RepID=A0A3L6QNN8_PANMI|nr:putative protein phosphatase 2C 74 [Panicum miliaceum]